MLTSSWRTVTNSRNDRVTGPSGKPKARRPTGPATDRRRRTRAGVGRPRRARRLDDQRPHHALAGALDAVGGHQVAGAELDRSGDVVDGAGRRAGLRLHVPGVPRVLLLRARRDQLRAVPADVDAVR